MLYAIDSNSFENLSNEKKGIPSGNKFVQLPNALVE